jgi:hypothetical protein
VVPSLALGWSHIAGVTRGGPHTAGGRQAGPTRPSRSDRLRSQLARPGGRRKLRARLAHFADLDDGVCVSFPALLADGERAWVLHELQSRGAPEHCDLVCEYSALDGQRLTLSEALDGVRGHAIGTLISRVPGQLGFFEGEDGRCVLRRRDRGMPGDRRPAR